MICENDILMQLMRHIKYQLANIFTKPLSEEQFDFIRRELGMLMYPNTKTS